MSINTSLDNPSKNFLSRTFHIDPDTEQISTLKEHIRNLEQNLSINKEILSSVLGSSDPDRGV